MATKGKTRGPKEGKYVNKSEKTDKRDSRRKKVEKQVGAAKKP